MTTSPEIRIFSGRLRRPGFIQLSTEFTIVTSCHNDSPNESGLSVSSRTIPILSRDVELCAIFQYNIRFDAGHLRRITETRNIYEFLGIDFSNS